MAAPAYRYNAASYRSSAAPRPQTRPQFTVVPGRRKQQQGVSDATVLLAKILLVVFAAFAVMAIGRVAISAAAIDTAMASESLETQIETVRAQSNSLEVQQSYLANPAHVRDVATNQLKMIAPTEVTTINAGDDVVKTDESGTLSLSSSLAAAASQG